MRMGYSKEQVLVAFAEVSESSPKKEISSLWPAVLCRLREDQVYGLHSESKTLREDCHAISDTYTNPNGNKLLFFVFISNCKYIKKVQRHNPYIQEV